jgi:hypothetical protein
MKICSQNIHNRIEFLIYFEIILKNEIFYLMYVLSGENVVCSSLNISIKSFHMIVLCSSIKFRSIPFKRNEKNNLFFELKLTFDFTILQKILFVEYIDGRYSLSAVFNESITNVLYL